MQHSIIFKNTFFQIITKLITSVSGLVFTIVIAKQYGQEGYGSFTQIVAFVGIMFLFIDFGLNAIYIKSHDTSKKFATLLQLRLIISAILFLSLVFVCLVLFMTSHITAEFLWMSILYSLSLFSTGVIISCTARLQKTHNYEKVSYATVIGSSVTLLLLLVLFITPLPLFILMFIYSIGTMVTAGVLYHLVNAKISVSFDKKYAVGLIKKSLPLGLMLLCNFVYFRFDILLLTAFRNTQEIGVYGLAYRFFEFTLTLPLYLSNSLYPFLNQRQKFNSIGFRNKLNYAFVFLVFSIFVTIFCWVGAPLLGLIKTEFKQSIDVFRLLIIFLPVFFLTNYFQWLLIAKDKQKNLFGIYLLGAVINIVLNILFIPSYGIIASAVITGLSEVFILFCLVFMLLRKAGHGTHRTPHGTTQKS